MKIHSGGVYLFYFYGAFRAVIAAEGPGGCLNVGEKQGKPGSADCGL